MHVIRMDKWRERRPRCIRLGTARPLDLGLTRIKVLSMSGNRRWVSPPLEIRMTTFSTLQSGSVGAIRIRKRRERSKDLS